MNRDHFDGTENSELQAKIDKAKQQLPLPDLMRRLGYPEKHNGKTALCPFHHDKHPSFSVFQKPDGTWWHNCFVGCSQGDEIAFFEKAHGLSRREAIKRYLDFADFPACPTPKSHEYPELSEPPKSPKCPKSLESPCVSCVSVSPVSEGQGLNGEVEKELRGLATRNACTHAEDVPEKKRFKLARDLAAVQKRIGRDLSLAEIKRTCDRWEGASTPFVGLWDDDDYHFTKLLAELPKVRVPTGEGDTLNKALEAVSKLSLHQLPEIPGCAVAPERWRRIAALHRELSRLGANGKYFLSYRDAYAGLSHQQAYDITTGALVRAGVIRIDNKGRAGLNSSKAAEFRYLLPQTENPCDDDEGFDL
jgi:CHC2 zinc finger